MGTAMFYHLTQRPLEDTLRMLLTRSLDAGWRVAVRGVDAAQLEALDAKLWQGEEAGFLPHGLAGGPHDALQPVLLTSQKEASNAAECLMTIEGADVTPEDVAAHTRVCVLFDGNDPQMLNIARAQWKALKEAHATAQYWSEESGRWEMKAET